MNDVLDDLIPDDSLRGERVVLMPVQPDDHRFLFWLANTGQNAARWRYRMQVPPFEVFVQQLHHEVLAQFVVLDAYSSDRIGHVVAYAADMRSGTTYVGCVMSPERLGAGVGKEALDVFIDYLLMVWPFRKVYAEVPDFTLRHFEASGHDFGEREVRKWNHEATLREHVYCAGRYWDMHIVSMDVAG